MGGFPKLIVSVSSASVWPGRLADTLNTAVKGRMEKEYRAHKSSIAAMRERRARARHLQQYSKHVREELRMLFNVSQNVLYFAN